jgi:Uma2 family endonuclease
MTQTIERKIYTPHEYLELELASETCNEYHNGFIIPMTGDTPGHHELAINLAALLKTALQGKPYGIFATDQKLWVSDRNLYAYPDVMVIAEPLQLQTGRNDTPTNPCFIAEVLSPATRNYDRRAKFAAYRTLSSFCEYLIIDQTSIHVEHYVKTAANQWLFSEYSDPSVTFSLTTVDTQIAIADLYKNIEINPENL